MIQRVIPDVKTMEMTVRRTIPASPAEVYDAWLEPKHPGTPEGAFAAVHQCRRGALHFAGLPHAYQVGTRGVSVADMLARTKAGGCGEKDHRARTRLHLLHAVEETICGRRDAQLASPCHVFSASRRRDDDGSSAVRLAGVRRHQRRRASHHSVGGVTRLVRWLAGAGSQLKACIGMSSACREAVAGSGFACGVTIRAH